MSLAILKKKTKATSPYFSKEHCFVLNMTGRGGGIKTKLKKNACAKVEYMDTKSCNDKWKLHKPAPQMGYGVYINKKAKGSHRPSGYECKNPADCVTTSKPVWKLTSTYDSSLVIEKNKLKALNCNKYDTPLDSISGKPTSVAKPCPAGVKQNKRDHTSINKKWCNNVCWKAAPSQRQWPAQRPDTNNVPCCGQNDCVRLPALRDSMHFTN